MATIPRAHGAVVFIGAAILAACVWALSPIAVGHAEPWDAASGVYYLGALFFVGLLMGVWSRRLSALVIVPCGAWFGQAVFMLVFRQASPLIALGLALLAAYLPPVIAGVGSSLLIHRTLGVCREQKTSSSA